MTKFELIADVARLTGVKKEYVAMVYDTIIDTIKATVERGEEVTLNDFMRIYLREKDETTATDFRRRDRMMVSRRTVPWVKVSRKWRRHVIALYGASPNGLNNDTEKNQMSIFDVIPKDD